MNIPEGATNIGKSAFEGCINLTSATLPSTLTSVGTYAFSECSSLTKVQLPESIKIIPSHLFSNCKALKTVTAASDLTGVGYSAFHNCAALESFNIPATVTNIEGYAFYGCSSIYGLDLPVALTNLGQSAFFGCAKLDSLTIPQAITSVPSSLCQNCSSMVYVGFASEVTEINSQAFSGCISLKDIELTEGLKTIAYDAFRYTALSDVKLPSTVTSLASNSFGDCDNIRTFRVNEGCTSICTTGSPSAWNGCDNLTVLYLPSTVTNMYYATFTDIPNIKEVHIKATTPPSPAVGSYNFGKSGCTLYVPEGCAATYKAHNYWKNRWDAIVEEAYGLASISDEEWNILKQLPTLTGGENWTRKWVLGATKAETELPEGVTVSNGHVVSLSLCGNNLTGRIPYVVFGMPYLRSLDLSGNRLSGDIGADDPTQIVICDSVRMLDISSNQLTGDLYDVMTFAPNLTMLYANKNKIRDISQPLPVYTLEYDGQDLTDSYTVNYSEFFNLKGDAQTAVPTILTYNNKQNSTESENIDDYNTYMYVYLSDVGIKTSGNNWYMTLHQRLTSNSTANYYSYESWCDGWYTYPSGTTMPAGIGSSYYWDERHKFNIVMDYAMGDVNFDTQVDVSDMQRTLNTALDETYYSRYSPFNFYAANIIATDAIINVQDVVANINLILDQEVPVAMKRNMKRNSEEEQTAEAALYVENGQLILNSSRPIAALDICLTDRNVKWSSAMNLFSKSERNGRTIFYSMFGDELPAGVTVLAETNGQLTNAMLVDLDANKVAVRLEKGDLNSIENLPVDTNHNDAIYDLQGRRYDKTMRRHLQPGIYIINGKKVAIQ